MRALRRALLAWYRRTARDLPWRRTRDPYHVWVSEILLQQTRVETAEPYYERLVAAFPSVRALATASLDQVLRLWQGLGYYTRARNLHQAAQIIVKEYRGQLPDTSEAWRRLPGVGRYTAGAIASIAFGERVAAVDGNVKRVLARLFCIERPVEQPDVSEQLWALAGQLLPRSRPGDFNQALMELGARVCVPKRPGCDACPVREWCVARSRGVHRTLPLRRPKSRVAHVEAVAAAVRKNGRYLFVQRPPRGLLGGLWELPGGPLTDGLLHGDALCAHLRTSFGIEVYVGAHLGTVDHRFSHRALRVHVYRCEQVGGRPRPRAHSAARWAMPTRVDRLAFASVDRKILALLAKV